MQWKAPVVFDNLISSREIPVTIGVFIQPGRVVAADTGAALDRFNRSFEYDGLGDNYVRFILDEILPDVEKHQAADGRATHFSGNPMARTLPASTRPATSPLTTTLP